MFDNTKNKIRFLEVDHNTFSLNTALHKEQVYLWYFFYFYSRVQHVIKLAINTINGVYLKYDNKSLLKYTILNFLEGELC
jgi:hypothetical protein